LAVNVLLARLLTPKEMGAYFLTLSLVLVATIVAQLGLNLTIVRLVAESMGTGRPGRARQSVLWTLRLAGIGTLVVACSLAFGGGQWIAERMFHSALMPQVMGLSAVWMAALTFQSLIAETFRGFHDIRFATIFGGVTTSILSMLLFATLWLLQGHGDLDQVIMLAIVAGMSSVTLSVLLLGKRLSALPVQTETISLKEIQPQTASKEYVSNRMSYIRFFPDKHKSVDRGLNCKENTNTKKMEPFSWQRPDLISRG